MNRKSPGHKEEGEGEGVDGVCVGGRGGGREGGGVCVWRYGRGSGRGVRE